MSRRPPAAIRDALHDNTSPSGAGPQGLEHLPDARQRLRDPGASLLTTSNSRGDDAFDVNEVGVHTARYRVRGTSNAYQGLRDQPGSVVGRHDLYLQVDGWRYGCVTNGLVYAEGRLSALIDGPGSDRLCAPRELEDGAAVLRERLRGWGVDPGEHVGLGRVDLAGDLRFDSGSDGRKLLRAAASADAPSAKTQPVWSKGRVETVRFTAVRGTRQLGKIYDRGRRVGSHGPGDLVRYEREVPWEKERELSPSQALALPLSQLFLEQFRSFLGSGDLLVAPVLQVVDEIWRRQAEGAIKAREADALTSYVTLHAQGLTDRLSTRITQRRAKLLKSIGLAVANGSAVEAEVVPVGLYLSAFERAWKAAEL